MKICEECRNELSIVGRYIHPILGKKHIICGNCHTQFNNIITKWRNFILVNPRIINSLDIDGNILKYDFKNIVTSIMKSYNNSSNSHYISGDNQNISFQLIQKENNIITMTM